MRGEKRVKELEAKLEDLESQLNLKLISESDYSKSGEVILREIDQIVYKDAARELKNSELEIKQLTRHNERLTRDYLIYLAADKKAGALVEDVIKINLRGIKRTKKFRTFLLNLMKNLSKNL